MGDELFQYIDDDPVHIGKKRLDGHYACIEQDGSIVIRNLKREAKEWGVDRGKYWSTVQEDQYPYMMMYNLCYMEMHHWSESKKFGCDYEKDGCHIKPDDVVVDIGANIGIFTRLALQRGAKKVYAFEPSIDLFKCLSLNVDTDMVELYKACVGSHTGLTRIASSVGSHPMVRMEDQPLPEDKHFPNQEVVSCYSLDDLFNHELFPQTVDFMKVDVEGAEIEVFEGLSEWNLRRINRIAMETHHSPAKLLLGRGDKIADLETRLKSNFSKHVQCWYGRGGKQPWTETLNFWRD